MKKISLLMLAFCLGFQAESGPRKTIHVLMIGIDGMSSAGFQHAYTPHLDQIAAEGLLTLDARIVMPSVSAPNWATHLMGAGPEQHGVTFNGWTPASTILTPLCTDARGYFPSVFTVIKQQNPKAKTCFFYDWKELADMFHPEDIGFAQYQAPEEFKENVREAADYFIREKPDFAFLYIGHPDEIGHMYKWESPEYLRAIEEVDEALGYLFEKLRQSGLYDDTFIIVVSDHGGVEYSHGGLSATEMNVPWMMKGPGVVKGKMYALPFNTLQTAPTVISLLGLDLHSCWIGRPAEKIFENEGGAVIHKAAFVPAPELPFYKIMSDAAVKFEIKTPYKDVVIRYEIGDKIPNASSPVYTGPFLMEKSNLVHVAAFRGNAMSRVETAEVIKVQSLESYELSTEPSPRYAGAGAATLFDLKEAPLDFKDKAWLGFEGASATTSIVLKKPNAEKVVVSCLHQPSSWIFAPRSIQVEGSADGLTWKSVGQWTASQEYESIIKGKLRLEVPLKDTGLKYLRIFVESIGKCPEGHSGAGKPGWLFLDEVWVE